MVPCGLGSGEISHRTAASPALCPRARVCPSGPRVLGSALCCLTGEVGWWGGRGEWTLPSGGWRWNSHGLAGRAGDHQAMPCPKEPFGINLLKMEEGSSPRSQLGDAVLKACKRCRNVVIASSLRCDLCLTRGSFFTLCSSYASAQLLSFKALSFAWWSVPAMKSILDMQGAKGGCLFICNSTSLPQCSSSSSQLVEPVLCGSARSSCGLPCCRWYICLLSDLNPNHFHASGKIPMSCQCFWMCWVGLQAPDPAGVWERQPGLGLGSRLLVLHP